MALAKKFSLLLRVIRDGSSTSPESRDKPGHRPWAATDFLDGTPDSRATNLLAHLVYGTDPLVGSRAHEGTAFA
jgi:hypothetical protein